MTDELEGPEDMRALWCAVIMQALNDVRGANSGTSSNEAQAALKWITRPNRDFDEVCSLAGLDPDAVRERAQQALAAPTTGKGAPKLSGRRVRAGVVADFAASEGTGGGRHAQDISELEFSE